jgi:hypothetical protein
LLIFFPKVVCHGFAILGERCLFLLQVEEVFERFVLRILAIHQCTGRASISQS